MTFIEEFIYKGYLNQCTDLARLSAITQEAKIAAYIGFDCTATSLHIGSLMQIMILRLLQKHGHTPIVIIGGGTSKIGDPAGKDVTRKALTQEDIKRNAEGIKKSLSKFIKFGKDQGDAIILDNAEWLDSLNYLDFLRDFGSYFSVNRMLTMDSVKLRLDRSHHLSFLELNYMLLQSYDFYYLSKNYNCILQLGGSDQWGNIVIGADLIRKISGKEVFGMTTPLLTTASGAKMGKTAAGAVWLNEDLLSPYDYYQYWRNCEDADVMRFAKLYSELDIVELNKFESLVSEDINAAKKQLAYELTKLCHGERLAKLALETAVKIFEQGDIDENLHTFILAPEILQSGISAYNLFYNANLARSKSEARKIIRGKGAKINDQLVEDENMTIDTNFLRNRKVIKLSVGKKRHILVKV
ncbi:tyrosine--tRNA ligase [Rickettsia prowazekii]|uniref:Tyrosine--tRNA ligase n=2 Tax=Rickettsia prowazekii TaxID=782 RepID=SYY_RICPR|nr:tyrosine--tRNA ligase [Rickettsia prowazekii]Q9ZCZ4.1 RecName: Full=Tyrosine--tRNA ligase; AltName: Full=Tyrosyl-tRNA synthetase; Short=TyrRS [Rickettsia prowazekii str. Madrid E]EOB09928.1 Tyrosine--tRNA ligase [Rickettsia prowazekii str. GvF12]ADE30090.1 Tyrosyl-tRNA synthetase [Rickettsia prowazekii str. Rp22]AFE49359.1 tyrosyl-tRNA synthetase [Rickettsia prowazekii str. Chernikova]AFE50203.1 tyrosyl-tRNA synthetase [Rickettsia prowazekii str. Katsinyian]AFE51049.1 tyrosyl-tRNA syntheta